MKNVPVSLLWFGSRRGQAGYTLIELILVVAILALAAAVAFPSGDAATEARARLAAAEFAAAIRFARDESIRTGKPHGFRFLTNQYRIRVFSVDSSGSPWTWVWNVYDPIDKALYDYTVPASLAGASAPVTHDPQYRGTCNRPGVVYFDASGTPWCIEPETVLLESYRLDFMGGANPVSVQLDGITGRVSSQ